MLGFLSCSFFIYFIHYWIEVLASHSKTQHSVDSDWLKKVKSTLIGSQISLFISFHFSSTYHNCMRLFSLLSLTIVATTVYAQSNSNNSTSRTPATVPNTSNTKTPAPAPSTNKTAASNDDLKPKQRPFYNGASVVAATSALFVLPAVLLF